MQPHIVLGMSGGVDSSVAALLLLERGYAVTGVFMKNWEEDDDTGLCTARQDFADAQQVCKQLGIPLRTVNFAAEYWEQVFEVALAEFQAGHTPNPDILCNRHIKFKAFLDYANDLGADCIATGHYARITKRSHRYALLRAADAGKDQTYFLYTLNQYQLARTLFPLGDLQKSEVRYLARKAGFDNHGKPDSTGVCFIGERRFRPFLQRFLPKCPGDIETTEGRVVGRHEGLMYYTLGQRRGLGIGGVEGAAEEPWYVLRKDPERNVLIVGQGHDHPALLYNAVEVGKLDWVSGSSPRSTLRHTAKTRYRQADQTCRMQCIEEGRVRVIFDRPQRAMTPGQSIVFYSDAECLGGGVIERILSLDDGSAAETGEAA